MLEAQKKSHNFLIEIRFTEKVAFFPSIFSSWAEKVSTENAFQDSYQYE